jgi:hypothetical protein
MQTHTWYKDLLFLTAAFLGFAVLTIFLMAADRVRQPKSFDPASSEQRDIEIASRRVDNAFETDWQEHGLNVQTAARADDLTIARRLSLGLMGTLPSLQEIREFESQPSDLRIQWWVSHLLEDRRTSNQIAERMARAFVGVDDGPFLIFRRHRFTKWLSDKIFDNQRYDSIVRELLTREGLWTDTPAVNFYTKTVADEGTPDPIVLAGRTSRAMLGMRIDCLQCHDDFLGTINLGSAEDPDSGAQTDFHSLAAFFARTNLSLLGITEGGDRNYTYKLLHDDEETVIKPAVPFHRELVDNSQEVLSVRLANWVTHPRNRPFSRAVVNRIWAIVCGKPMIEPVDDIPLEGPFPRAMEVLVDDFVAHEFDLQRLIRIIAGTATFQRDSEADFEITAVHDQNWMVFPLMRLRPDQVAGAVIQSVSLTTIDSTSHIVQQLAKFGQQNEFVKRYGDAGENEFQTRGETVTQRLLMLNGEMIKEQLQSGLNSPQHIGVLSPETRKSIETVYLATLTRRPSGQELEYFRARLDGFSGDEYTEKVQDLYWTLINSIEFVWNH